MIDPQFDAIELAKIAEAGASLSIDGSLYSAAEIEAVVRHMHPNAQLIVNRNWKRGAADLLKLAALAPGRIHFR